MFSADRIKTIVEGKLPDCTAIVIDDVNDGRHFTAEVTSTVRSGMSFSTTAPSMASTARAASAGWPTSRAWCLGGTTWPACGPMPSATAH